MVTKTLSPELLRKMDAYWRANCPLGRTDLSLRQSAAKEGAQAGAHQTAPARPLGHDAGTELRL